LKPSLYIDAVEQILLLTDHFKNKIPQAWNEEVSRRLDMIAETNPNLQSFFNVMKLTYKAPINQPFEDITSNSIDIIFSNTTLEHISITKLRHLITASKRVLTSDGIMVHLVDCSDHFSHSDHSISRINFLRYSNAEWQKYQSKFTYQNRLRASQYREFFEDAGFDILLWTPKISEKLRPLINNLPISKEFQKYDIDDLITTEIAVVARLQG
jgi:SAM-dependent methyltransferase